jgi:hypothetical protein
MPTKTAKVVKNMWALEWSRNERSRCGQQANSGASWSRFEPSRTQPSTVSLLIIA